MPFAHTCWVRDSPTFPGHPEYMEIHTDVGRIICSAVVSIDPIRIVPMGMAYRECEPGYIKTQLRPGDDWVDHTYRFEDDLAIWNHAGGMDWAWIAIPCNQFPSRFSELQQRAQKRMDERQAAASENEETQQAVDGNPH